MKIPAHIKKQLDALPKPTVNPNVKTDFNDDEYELIARQVRKYFGEEEFPTHEDDCLICPLGSGCKWCPLNGVAVEVGCTFDKTFIHLNQRANVTPDQLLLRGYRLIQILDANGITIFDEVQ